MASCQINITGASGTVVIRYVIAGTANTITADLGDAIYISDTATAITYTNLSGDAIAASGCVTITELVSTCYLFEWQTDRIGCATGDIFDAIILGVTTSTITNVSKSASYSSVATSLETLADPLITPYAGKVEMGTNSTAKNSLIITILGTDVPTLRINNPMTSFKTYLIGTTITCLPIGYTLLDACAPAP